MAYLTSAQVRDRYKISDMTLFRWSREEGMEFPKPFVVKRRKLYDEDDLIRWERKRAKLAQNKQAVRATAGKHQAHTAQLGNAE
nr:DNA-binding protein [Rhizobium sp. Q54]